MRPSGRLVAPALALVALLAPLAPASVSAAPSPSPAPEQLLARPLSGDRAVARLGDRLPVAAARNGMGAEELRRILATDPTARLDTTARLHYVEPTAPAARAASTTGFQPVAPLADTFALHSRPGAERVVFLDVDGATLPRNAWEQSGSHPAWNPAGDGPAFSDSERVRVQQVWALVAEDFAPFDVDVTTEDPGPAGLVRSSSTDRTYGAHVLISPSDAAWAGICARSCGGIAYVDVFSEVDAAPYQPAWVFPQGLGHQPKYVAEAASHEVGHQLGLDHDGTASSGYSSGHGSWAPIMGGGYGRPIVQWSRGAYPGADNPEDDLATIRGHLGVRPDEAPTAPAGAPPVPGGPAFVTSAADVDSWSLGTCQAGATVAARPAAYSPNLDLGLVLRDATGTVVAMDDPASGPGDGATATGMAASLTLAEAAAGLTVSVAGQGRATWSTQGYDSYGSIGAYAVTVTGCTADDVVPPVSPGTPQQVVAVRGDRSATVSWRAPAAGGPVTGYTVIAAPGGQSVAVGAGGTSAVLTGLRNGTPYVFSVVATGDAGPSAASAPSATVVPAGVPARPGRPTVRAGRHRLVATWTAPDANGAALTGYELLVRGARSRTVPVTATRQVVRGLPRGRYRVRVVAVNDVGRSPAGAVRRVRLR